MDSGLDMTLKHFFLALGLTIEIATLGFQSGFIKVHKEASENISISKELAFDVLPQL